MKKNQQGITLIGLIFVGIIVAILLVVGARVLPTVIEYQAIYKGVNEAAKVSDSVAEVRSSFDKTALINQIRSISGKDLEVSKGTNGAIVVSFAYEREIPLFGPAYLLLKYEGTTASGRRGG